MPLLTLKDGTRLYYEVHGKGPVVAFAHGLGGNHMSWWQQVPMLARHFTCIAFAHRGFAPSHDPTGMPDPARYADDLEALLGHLAVEEVRLVGQSMGGWTALDFALRYPDRVKALVMSATIGTADPARLPGTKAQERSRWEDWARGEQARLREAGLYPATGERMAREQPQLHHLYQQIGRLAADFDREAMRKRLWERRAVQSEALAALTFPVLCLAGLEDVVINPALVKALAGALPVGCFEPFPETGHSPYFERAARFNTLLLEFLSASK
ncbi:MAG: alpha/beta hydrolase [Proteobacteria bacterium]|nr:alpha/beta hydrolase [Pseudomonadota bacterium]MDA0982204.1 alpha/beta hydrolase [Pseudomonadota bacterium]